jgi:hypothetical protein
VHVPFAKLIGDTSTRSQNETRCRKHDGFHLPAFQRQIKKTLSDLSGSAVNIYYAAVMFSLNGH